MALPAVELSLSDVFALQLTRRDLETLHTWWQLGMRDGGINLLRPCHLGKFFVRVRSGSGYAMAAFLGFADDSTTAAGGGVGMSPRARSHRHKAPRAPSVVVDLAASDMPSPATMAISVELGPPRGIDLSGTANRSISASPPPPTAASMADATHLAGPQSPRLNHSSAVGNSGGFVAAIAGVSNSPITMEEFDTWKASAWPREGHCHPLDLPYRVREKHDLLKEAASVNVTVGGGAQMTVVASSSDLRAQPTVLVAPSAVYSLPPATAAFVQQKALERAAAEKAAAEWAAVQKLEAERLAKERAAEEAAAREAAEREAVAREESERVAAQQRDAELAVKEALTAVKAKGSGGRRPTGVAPSSSTKGTLGPTRRKAGLLPPNSQRPSVAAGPTAAQQSQASVPDGQPIPVDTPVTTPSPGARRAATTAPYDHGPWAPIAALERTAGPPGDAVPLVTPDAQPLDASVVRPSVAVAAPDPAFVLEGPNRRASAISHHTSPAATAVGVADRLNGYEPSKAHPRQNESAVTGVECAAAVAPQPAPHSLPSSTAAVVTQLAVERAAARGPSTHPLPSRERPYVGTRTEAASAEPNRPIGDRSGSAASANARDGERAAPDSPHAAARRMPSPAGRPHDDGPKRDDGPHHGGATRAQGAAWREASGNPRASHVVTSSPRGVSLEGSPWHATLRRTTKSPAAAAATRRRVPPAVDESVAQAATVRGKPTLRGECSRSGPNAGTDVNRMGPAKVAGDKAEAPRRGVAAVNNGGDATRLAASPEAVETVAIHRGDERQQSRAADRDEPSVPATLGVSIARTAVIDDDATTVDGARPGTHRRSTSADPRRRTVAADQPRTSSPSASVASRPRRPSASAMPWAVSLRFDEERFVAYRHAHRSASAHAAARELMSSLMQLDGIFRTASASRDSSDGNFRSSSRDHVGTDVGALRPSTTAREQLGPARCRVTAARRKREISSWGATSSNKETDGAMAATPSSRTPRAATTKTMTTPRLAVRFSQSPGRSAGVVNKLLKF